MIGLEISAPKGHGFVSNDVRSLKKGSNGYGNPRVVTCDDDKVRGEPTKIVITHDTDDDNTHFFAATLTDKDGNITPYSATIVLGPMRPLAVEIPADFGSVSY